MAQADRICRRNQVRLTPIRKQVLTLIWQSHKPLGAYDIIAMLSNETKTVAPPTVYRAIDFLREQGLVHRIASRNAFVGCSQQQENRKCQFLLCRECGIAVELDSNQLVASIESSARQLGFSVDDETIEISGWCPKCKPLQEK